MIFDLPEALDVGGTSWSIRTDFRDILTIILAFEDPELEAQEKVYVCLFVLYENFDEMPSELYDEAFKKAMDFIDHGTGGEETGPKTVDWEQDARLLFPAINHVAGYEVRGEEYLHWWTFLGFFMEISDGVYSTVLSLRCKKARHKKLEKWEQEWWNQNISICKLKPKYTDEEKAEQERLKAILG